MDAAPWPTEWLRGVLDVCVLAVLDEGPTYGYAISARLTELGLGAIKGGTLYPLLSRLEQADLVSTEWRPGVGGPGRKYFALTTTGHDELRRLRPAWAAFTHVTAQIVGDHSTQSNVQRAARHAPGEPGPDRAATPAAPTAAARPGTTTRSSR
ncbi:PadR family transcriptional regulator [Cellulomonas sp. URHE0023]|uniref:PadR family transcriptional regulator n=1 Tax=Cellulomonas sp. URHE0023 TaxID=1380354 RepID=UPI0009DD9640